MTRLALLILTIFGLTVSQLQLVAAEKTTYFVFAKIKDPVEPIERGAKYEDPLHEALSKAKLGEVTGGGSMLTKEKKIDWVGVDIELVNLTQALTFTQKRLRDLGAPKGSVLEFERDGKRQTLSIHDD